MAGHPDRRQAHDRGPLAKAGLQVLVGLEKPRIAKGGQVCVSERGERIVFSRAAEGTGLDIWSQFLGDDGQPQVFQQTEVALWRGIAVERDGRGFVVGEVLVPDGRINS
jgi:hypothetical protein